MVETVMAAKLDKQFERTMKKRKSKSSYYRAGKCPQKALKALRRLTATQEKI